MDFTSSLKSEIFRPFSILIIPGAVDIFPYIFVLWNTYPNAAIFVEKYPSHTIVLFLIAVVAIGLVLEDFGSFFESLVYDKILNKQDPDHLKNWHKYLGLAFEIEPVGHRYIRTIVLRLKFELSFAFACILFWLGLLWLKILDILIIPMGFLYLSIILFLIVAYLFWEGYSSAKVLSETRRDIIERMRKT
jgi:hypothetical protein